MPSIFKGRSPSVAHTIDNLKFVGFINVIIIL